MRRANFIVLACLSLGAAVSGASTTYARPVDSSGARLAAEPHSLRGAAAVRCVQGMVPSTTPSRMSSGWVLIGERAVEPRGAESPSGLARAFSFRSKGNGTVSAIAVYVGSGNRAKKLAVALYANANCRPGTRLTSGSLASPQARAWNTVTVRHAVIRAGRTYWLAVLGRGGGLRLRDRTVKRCSSYVARSRSGVLPSSWKAATASGACEVSAYAVGVNSSPTFGVFATTGSGGTDTTAPGVAGNTPGGGGSSGSGSSGGGSSGGGSSGGGGGSSPAAPANSAAPAIAGTPVSGQTLSTTTGGWTGNPSSYLYQWDDCNAAGSGCTPIPAATSSSYVLTGSDVGYTVRSAITAINGAGVGSASSAATSVVSVAGGCGCSSLQQIDGGPHYFANMSSKSQWADSNLLIGGWFEEPSSSQQVEYDSEVGDVYFNLAGWPVGQGGSVDYNVIRCPTNTSSTTVCAGGMHVLAPSSDSTSGAETIGFAGQDEPDLNYGAATGSWKNNSNPNGGGVGCTSGNCGYSIASFYHNGTPLPASGPTTNNYPLDGRPISQGMGEGVLFFETNNSQAAQWMNYSDIESADSYWISGSNAMQGYSIACMLVPSLSDPRCDNYTGNGTGLTLAQEDLPANYAYNVSRLELLDTVAGTSKPVIVPVETDCPFGPPRPCTTPAQMTASAWHALIAGARGIEWFEQDYGGGSTTDGDTGSGTSAACPGTVYAGLNSSDPNHNCVYYRDGNGSYTVAQMAAAQASFYGEATALTPELLSPTAVGEVSTSADVSVLAKSVDNNTECWVFAGAGQPIKPPASNMSATFSLADRYSGPVTVYGESRTLTAVNGSFTDAFADANAVHIYQIPGPC